MKLEIDFQTGSEEIAARAERNVCQAFMSARGSYNAGNSHVIGGGGNGPGGGLPAVWNPLLQRHRDRQTKSR